MPVQMAVWKQGEIHAVVFFIDKNVFWLGGFNSVVFNNVKKEFSGSPKFVHLGQ